MKQPINERPKNSTTNFIGSDNLDITMTKSPSEMSKAERVAAIGSIPTMGMLRLKNKKRRKKQETEE